MRITFLLTGYPWKPWGGARVVYEYANALVAKGHDVAVVHPRRMPADTLPTASIGLAIRRRLDRVRNTVFRPTVSWQRLDERVGLLWVPELSARNIPDADVVIATWWGTAESVLRLPITKGRKAYLIQGYETWGGPPERVDATWRAPIAKVVVARWLYDKGIELGVNPQSLTYIPNAIDHERFRVTEPIADRSPRVAMMSSAMAWKGTRDGVLALERARVRFPDLQAVCFGTDRRPTWMPEWVDYHRNPAQDTLVRLVYNASAIYLCSSWTEGWGLPAAEAMACGCALVTTDCGGVRDFAVHGETALLSAPRDIDTLAGNVIHLLEDHQTRRRLASAGVDLISEFTWSHSADRFIEFLHCGASDAV